MSWETVLLAGKAADVFQPIGGVKPGLGLVFLHDLDMRTLVDRPAFVRILEELNLACICPHGRRSWWGERTCPEFDAALSPERHLLDHVVPCFGERWGLPPRGLGILGIGMGGQGALRLAFRHPEMFPAMAGIASALDYHEIYGQGSPLDEMYDSREQCRQDTALMHIQPFKYPPHIFFSCDPTDAWQRGNDRLHEKLSALGITHTCDLSTEAGGHSWDYFDRMAEPALRFLHAGLVAESRRLL